MTFKIWVKVKDHNALKWSGANAGGSVNAVTFPYNRSNFGKYLSWILGSVLR